VAEVQRPADRQGREVDRVDVLPRPGRVEPVGAVGLPARSPPGLEPVEGRPFRDPSHTSTSWVSRAAAISGPPTARSAGRGPWPGPGRPGQPLAGLGHHRGRGLLQERRVGQLGLGPGPLGVEGGQLPLQPDPLLVQIEQPLQRQVQLAPRGQQLRSLTHRGGAFGPPGPLRAMPADDLHHLQAGQAADAVGLGLEQGRLVVAGGHDHQPGPARRRDPVLGPEPAQGHDGLLEVGHGRLGLRVEVAGPLGRPGAEGQGLDPGEGPGQLLGDERHDRVQQPQRHLEGVGQGGPGPLGVLAAGGQPRLGQLDRPVGQLAPGEPVQQPGRLGRVVGVVGGGHLGPGALQARQQPAVGQRPAGGRLPGRGAGGPDHEPAEVPELVGEVARPLDPLLGQRHIPARVGPADQGEPQGVGPVAVHQLDRVDDVPERLGHLLALGVADHPVDGHDLEGGRGLEVAAEHQHPGHPEEDDVVPGDQHRRSGRRLPGPRSGRPARGSRRATARSRTRCRARPRPGPARRRRTRRRPSGPGGPR
jgi:hypothetical protein